MRPLGRTGLTVSPIGFGTTALGDMPETYGFDVGEAQARATLDAIFDSPVNFLDTSRIYGSGRSEARIGAAIRARGGLPPGFVVSTKLDRDPESGRFDGDRARRSLEQSLQALGLSRVDILHLHDPEHAASLDEITGKGGALDALFQFREEGLARAVGLAAGRLDVMLPILAERDFDVVITHNRYTLVNRSAEPLIEACAARGIAVMNAAPYAGGLLTGAAEARTRYVYQSAPDRVLAAVHRLEELCVRYDVPLGAVALQLSLRDPRIAATVCGVAAPDQVRETLTWASLPVSTALWADLASLPFDTDDPEATRRFLAG